MSGGAIAGLAIGVTIAGIIIGIFIGFAIGQRYFKKQLKENPPVTREQIKAMYQQMGRTPSESQINQVMEAMKRNQK
ncbi:MAG: YneF family protein [Mycoplasmoidaceae bacterium]